MKIFLAWSGARSRHVANSLHRWLPNVMPGVQTWMSEHDVESGAISVREIEAALATSSIGILCLTPENLNARWIHFEAGAIWKALESSRTCPLLLDLKPADVPKPLGDFNGDDARSKSQVSRLLCTINRHRGERAVPEDVVKNNLEKWWIDWEGELKQLPSASSPAKTVRSDTDLLSEILETVRKLDRDRVVTATAKQMARSRSHKERLERTREAAIGDVLTETRELTQQLEELEKRARAHPGDSEILAEADSARRKLEDLGITLRALRAYTPTLWEEDINRS